MATPEERFAAAKARVEARYADANTILICNTPELATEHGVRLGDSVRIRAAQPFTLASVGESFDDYVYGLLTGKGIV